MLVQLNFILVQNFFIINYYICLQSAIQSKMHEDDIPLSFNTKNRRSSPIFRTLGSVPTNGEDFSNHHARQIFSPKI
jgi:hypothetical protein